MRGSTLDETHFKHAAIDHVAAAPPKSMTTSRRFVTGHTAVPFRLERWAATSATMTPGIADNAYAASTTTWAKGPRLPVPTVVDPNTSHSHWASKGANPQIQALRGET